MLLLVTSAVEAYVNYDNNSFCEEDCFCDPPVCCGQGFIGVDLLYWRAFESGLDTCVPTSVSDTVLGETATSTFSGSSRDPHFKWNPGFRLRAGYVSAYSPWDVEASWTHFHSHAENSGGNANELRWNFDFDVVDLTTGYAFDLSSCFFLRPFGGLRSVKIEQHLHIQEFPIAGSTGTFISSNKNNQEEFWGVGPLIGFEAEWQMCRGFSLYSILSVALLYGDFDIRLIESDLFVDASDFSNIKKHLHSSQVVADASLGIRWETCFCGNNRLLLQLGLEHHRYFDQGHLCGCGDLTLDGVTFGAAIGF